MQIAAENVGSSEAAMLASHQIHADLDTVAADVC